MRRPLVVALFAALFMAELGYSSIAPLIPALRGLSEAQAGLVITIASVGILVASLPAGALTRRFAVRTLTLWAMASITAADFTLALAHAFPVVLVGRLFFGVGLGTMWVTGTAWIHDGAGEDASRALAMTTAVVGVGALLGPAFAGFVAESFSLGTPFWMLGAGALAMTLVLLLVPSAVGRALEPSPPLADMLRAAGADQLMLTSIVLTLAVSMMWMTADLLVPIRLNGNGLSTAGIGLALSFASVTFIGMSALTARHADRYATVRIAAFWTLVMGAGIAVAALNSSTAATLVFLAIAGASSGVLIALTYPLGAIGARQGHFSVAVVGPAQYGLGGLGPDRADRRRGRFPSVRRSGCLLAASRDRSGQRRMDVAPSEQGAGHDPNVAGSILSDRRPRGSWAQGVKRSQDPHPRLTHRFLNRVSYKAPRLARLCV